MHNTRAQQYVVRKTQAHNVHVCNTVVHKTRVFVLVQYIDTLQTPVMTVSRQIVKMYVWPIKVVHYVLMIGLI